MLKKGVKRTDVITDDALAHLAESLTTPLQIERHLRLAFEEGYRVRQKPVETEIIDAILAKDINSLESRLTRHGYNAKRWQNYSIPNPLKYVHSCMAT